jgi:hypothetical protein
MADVASDLKTWSTTASSNSPSGSTAVGTGLDDNLRELQKVVRQDLASKGSDIASASTTDLGAVAGLMHDITGTTTITSFGTVSAGIWKIVKFEGILTLTHNATSLILPGAANITTANGDIAVFISEGSGNWRCVSFVKAAGRVPTKQVFTSGSGTYTTPAGATSLRIRMVGGGGGGGGAPATAGSSGGDTTFSTFTAGGGGSTTTGNGAGGTAAGGSINIPGGAGTGGGLNQTATTFMPGGQGGSSAFGPGGGGGQGNQVGQNAPTNSGGGGGGGGGAASQNSAGGGGGGGYVEAYITAPSSSYSYAVGSGGAGGVGASLTGGNGAAGIIIVDEFYD